MYEFIRHTVRKGSVVIYPRWQTAIATPCPGPFDIEPCMQVGDSRHPRCPRASAGAARSDGCSRTSSETSYFGFSFGGVITANLTNRYRRLNLPKPRAIWLEDPHDGAPERVRRAGGGRLAAGHPADGEAAMPLERRGRDLRAQQGGRRSCNAIFPKLGHIPKRNKDLVLTRPDAHGTPALRAPHGVCAARQGGADAYDWNFCWKVWDALRSCAYEKRYCRYALGNTRQHRSNGRWSDGRPIIPLKIQDAAPIRP